MIVSKRITRFFVVPLLLFLSIGTISPEVAVQPAIFVPLKYEDICAYKKIIARKLLFNRVMQYGIQCTLGVAAISFFAYTIFRWNNNTGDKVLQGDNDGVISNRAFYQLKGEVEDLRNVIQQSKNSGRFSGLTWILKSLAWQLVLSKILYSIHLGEKFVSEKFFHDGDIMWLLSSYTHLGVIVEQPLKKQYFVLGPVLKELVQCVQELDKMRDNDAAVAYKIEFYKEKLKVLVGDVIKQVGLFIAFMEYKADQKEGTPSYEATCSLTRYFFNYTVDFCNSMQNAVADLRTHEVFPVVRDFIVELEHTILAFVRLEKKVPWHIKN